MLIDSIMGTIDHIYCDNTFHVITEQNHRRNTIVRRGRLFDADVVMLRISQLNRGACRLGR